MAPPQRSGLLTPSTWSAFPPGSDGLLPSPSSLCLYVIQKGSPSPTHFKLQHLPKKFWIPLAPFFKAFIFEHSIIYCLPPLTSRCPQGQVFFYAP